MLRIQNELFSYLISNHHVQGRKQERYILLNPIAIWIIITS